MAADTRKAETDYGAHIGRTGWLGRLAPGIVFACLLLDIGTRFIPPRLVAFRAWEGMRVFATDGPFVSSAVFNNPRAYGDLSNLGNLPALRQYHSEVFHSDAAGFRNPHRAADPFGGVLLLGDSFGAGSGVSDQYTLTADLARLSGLPVYNGSGTPDALDRIPMSCGLVIWEVSERDPLARPIRLGWKGKLLQRVLGDRRREKIRLLTFTMDRYFGALLDYSLVGIWSHRIIRSVQNDRILPNAEKRLVEIRRLVNGRQMLFLPAEIENYQQHDRDTDPSYYIELRDILKARGIDLLVLLVPDKYVVYRDLLSPAEKTPEERPLFMNIVAERLSAAGVPVVNLTPTFQAQAAASLPQNTYLYSLDDTHWNANGIARAADEVFHSSVFPKSACLSAAPGAGR